jgi:hypothetical protein
MANTQGNKYLFGSPATLAMYDAGNAIIVTGYLSPDIENYDITHECDTEEVRNSIGEVVGHIAYNNRLTLTVNFIPVGTNATEVTALNQRLWGCSLPTGNGTVIISGAPIINVGGYADAINAPTGNRWIYGGGGSIKTTATGKATGTITLKRFTNLNAAGAATNLNAPPT